MLKKTLFGLAFTLAGTAALLLYPAANQATSPAAAQGELALATFAGGCFWCVEANFDKVPGVVKTISGYTGGHLADPTYAQVSAGGTGHLRACKSTTTPNASVMKDCWRPSGAASTPPTAAGNSSIAASNTPRRFSITPNSRNSPPKNPRGPRRQRPLPRSAGHADSRRGKVLRRGRLSSGLSHQESGPLHLYRHRSGRDQYLKRPGARS